MKDINKRLIKFYMNREFMESKWKFLVLVGVVATYIIFIRSLIEDKSLGFYDNLFMIYKGIGFESVKEPGFVFNFPMMWFFINIYVQFLVISLIKEDMGSLELQIILRCQNIKRWWVFQVVQTVITVIAYFLVLAVTILVMSFLFGRGFEGFDKGLLLFYKEAEAVDGGNIPMILNGLIVPCIFHIGLGLISISISARNKMVAFSLTIIMMIVGLFINNMANPLGYIMMIRRYSSFGNVGDTSYYMAAIVGVGVVFAVMTMMYLKKNGIVKLIK